MLTHPPYCQVVRNDRNKASYILRPPTKELVHDNHLPQYLNPPSNPLCLRASVAKNPYPPNTRLYKSDCRIELGSNFAFKALNLLMASLVR